MGEAAPSGVASECRREKTFLKPSLSSGSVSNPPPAQHRPKWRNVFRRRHPSEEMESGFGHASKDEAASRTDSDERSAKASFATIKVRRSFLRHWTAPPSSRFNAAAQASSEANSRNSREKVLQKVHFGPSQVREYTAFDWRLDGPSASSRGPSLQLEDLSSPREDGASKSESEGENAIPPQGTVEGRLLHPNSQRQTRQPGSAGEQEEDSVINEQLKAWGVAEPGSEGGRNTLGRARSLPTHLNGLGTSDSNSDSENVKDVLAAWCA